MGADGICAKQWEFYEAPNYIIGTYNFCPFVELYNVNDDEIVNNAVNNLITVVCLACGIKNINEYTEEV